MLLFSLSLFTILVVLAGKLERPVENKYSETIAIERDSC
jgi:hypothetical protein